MLVVPRPDAVVRSKAIHAATQPDTADMKAAESNIEGPGTPRRVAGADRVTEAERVLERLEIDPGDIDSLKKQARTLLQRGYTAFDDYFISDLCDMYSVEDDGIPATTDLAEFELQRLLAEQAGWPEDELEDMKKLRKAFGALERRGMISRANFSCCQRCGNGEIRGEASSQHLGYCYFHEQDLDACIEGRGLVLRHGVIKPEFPSPEERGDMATLIVQAMEEVGLEVEWNGDVGKVIVLPGFKWRVRLYDNSQEEEQEDEGEEIRGHEVKGEEVKAEEAEVDGENDAGEEDEAEEDEGNDLGLPPLQVTVR